MIYDTALFRQTEFYIKFMDLSYLVLHISRAIGTGDRYHLSDGIRNLKASIATIIYVLHPLTIVIITSRCLPILALVSITKEKDVYMLIDNM